jgi:hypothetical protein
VSGKNYRIFEITCENYPSRTHKKGDEMTAYKFLVSPKHVEKLKAVPGYKYASKVFNYKLPARYQWTEMQFVYFETDNYTATRKAVTDAINKKEVTI